MLYGGPESTLTTDELAAPAALLPATVTVTVLEAVTVAGGSPQGTTELGATTFAATTLEAGTGASLTGSGLTYTVEKTTGMEGKPVPVGPYQVVLLMLYGEPLPVGMG